MIYLLFDLFVLFIYYLIYLFDYLFINIFFIFILLLSLYFLFMFKSISSLYYNKKRGERIDEGIFLEKDSFEQSLLDLIKVRDFHD